MTIIYAIATLILVTVSLPVLTGSAALGAGVPTIPYAVVKTDKLVYNPGDEVTVTIEFNFQSGDMLELAVIKGIITQERIFYTMQPVQGTVTTVKFKLPEQDEFHQYWIRTTIHGHDVYGEAAYFGTNVLIFTKQGADKPTIGDLNIDKKEVRPGESIQLSFKVKDGTGSVIPWATGKIGLCVSSLEHSTGSVPWGTLSPDCVLFYNAINSSTDTLSLRLEIPNTVQPGDYKLNIWSYPFPYKSHAHESVDLQVKGDPVNPDEPIISQSVQWDIIRSKDHPSQLASYATVTYGDKITFYSYEKDGQYILGNPQLPPSIAALDLLAGKPAVPGVLVQVYIVDPYGKVVYNNKVVGDEKGNFQNMTLPITKDLQRGVYEIYYNVTKDGNYVKSSVSIDDSVDQFYLTNLQKFDIEAEGRSFNVYFQGIDVDASNPIFEQSKKSLSFDVQKIEGRYYNRHFLYTRDTAGTAGCVKIDIEKPLLTGPFLAEINGKQIDSCGYGSETGIIGPIDEDGRLTIIGTYVIPEFPINLIVASIAVGVMLAMTRFRNLKIWSSSSWRV